MNLGHGTMLDDDDHVDMFLNGRCGSFAIVASRLLADRGRTGTGVSLLFDDDQEPNTIDGRCAVHAYASCDGFDADARGVRTPQDMAEEYGLMSWDVDGPYSQQELAGMFADPMEIGIDPEWMTEAEAFLSRNPDLFENTEARASAGRA